MHFLLKNTLQNGIMVSSKGGDIMADEKKTGKGNKNSGRKYDQKMKPFLVYHYLMQNSDENNVAKTEERGTSAGIWSGSKEDGRSVYAQ